MEAEDRGELEGMLRAWPDVEPPARLDGAVRRQAYARLARQRAALAQVGSAYPAWLLALTGAMLIGTLILAATLPSARLAWRNLGPLPLARVGLLLVGSNLLAALAAPAMIIWSKSHGS